MTMIRPVLDGKKITEPGAYRMSMEWYHSQDVCPGPSVSSTGLRLLALESPHAFWKTWEGNPDRYPPKPPSEYMILGRAAHALILGDEVFNDVFAYVPDDAPRRPSETKFRERHHYGFWKKADKAAGEWWENFDKTAKNKLLLTADQVRHIQYMSENIAAHPFAVEVLKSELIEVSMVWQDERTGIWVKSRPDCIPSNGYDFGDLKTFSPRNSDLVLSAQRAITDNGYAMQMALAVMGSERVFDTTAANCALVFVQTSPPYEVLPINLDEEAIYFGRVLCRQALDRMAHGLESGDWPGVVPEVINYSFPPSLASRFYDMQANGDLPRLETS